MTPTPEWTAAGAHAVAPGVFRIPVPLPITSLHAVNVYLIEDPDGPTLVDAGWATADARVALDSGLRDLGYTFGDIAQFVVTHAHWDHYTQAVALRDEFGTRVRVGRGERPSIDGFDRSSISYPAQVPLLRAAGAGALADEVARLVPDRAELAVPFELPDGWLDDRQEIALTSRTLEVFATPGHTRGHIVLRDRTSRGLFSGDHVLPHITPSLALERAPEARPLRSFLQSLRLLRDQPDLRLFPAHGPVTESVHLRVDELLAHHGRRLDAAAIAVAEGRDTAYAVAQALTWTSRDRSLGELDTLNQMMAVLESAAHLDVLHELGRADRITDDRGVARWVAL